MGKSIDSIKFPALERYPRGPFSATNTAELKGYPVDILRQMCKRDRISTSGLQRKEQYVQALVQKGNNTAIRNMRFQDKPAAKRKRVTDSLRQSAASYPKASLQPIKEFLGAELEAYRDFFFEDSSVRAGLSSLRTLEFDSKQILVGNEDLGPHVTIVGIDREPIISKFPLHIWREYFYEGFEDKIQAFSVTTEQGYMPGQHFLVSAVPTHLYQEVQILFTLMANAKRDGIPLAISGNQAAEFFGLQQNTVASLPVTKDSLSSESFELQLNDAASLPVLEGSLSSGSSGLQLNDAAPLLAAADPFSLEPHSVATLSLEYAKLQNSSDAYQQLTDDRFFSPTPVVVQTSSNSHDHSWVDFSMFDTDVSQVTAPNVVPLASNLESVVPGSAEELTAFYAAPLQLANIEAPVDQELSGHIFDDRSLPVASESQLLHSKPYFQGLSLFEGFGDE